MAVVVIVCLFSHEKCSESVTENMKLDKNSMSGMIKLKKNMKEKCHKCVNKLDRILMS